MAAVDAAKVGRVAGEVDGLSKAGATLAARRPPKEAVANTRSKRPAVCPVADVETPRQAPCPLPYIRLRVRGLGADGRPRPAQVKAYVGPRRGVRVVPDKDGEGRPSSAADNIPIQFRL